MQKFIISAEFRTSSRITRAEWLARSSVATTPSWKMYSMYLINGCLSQSSQSVCEIKTNKSIIYLAQLPVIGEKGCTGDNLAVHLWHNLIVTIIQSISTTNVYSVLTVLYNFCNV